MKREILLPAAAWAGGLAGFLLRRQELAAAYDAQTKLMRADCPQTWLLCILAAALLALFAASCRASLRGRTAGGLSGGTGAGYPTLAAVAALALIAAGALGLWEQGRLYQKRVLALLVYAVCVAAGAAVLAAASQIRHDRRTESFPRLLMAAPFCALLRLILSYQQWAKQPVLLLYLWQLLAQVAVVLALYTMVSLSLGRGSAARVSSLSLWGISLTLISLADGAGTVPYLIALFSLLYLTAQAWLLLRVPPVPAQEPGEEMNLEEADNGNE